MARRRKNSTLIPEGEWPVRLIKSEVRTDYSGAKTWVTWFRHGNSESKAFFHLNATKIRPVVEKHAVALGLIWEGDVLEYLKKSHYADHHAIEGWEGRIRVKFKESDRRRYKLRICTDVEATR